MAVQGPSLHLVDILARSTLFADWPPAVLAGVARRFRPVPVGPGAVLCRQGDSGDDMFLIESGRFAVDVTLGGRQVRLAELGPGGVFGEIAIVTEQPRSATVTAQTKGRVWALNRLDFHELAFEYPQLPIAASRLARDRLTRTRSGQFANEHQAVASLADRDATITIGRDTVNDVVLADPLVSRTHARVRRVGERFEIEDLGSTNGTFVNQHPVRVAPLVPGAEVRIGQTTLIFDGSRLSRFSRGAGVKIDAIGLSKSVGKDTTILDEVSLSIYPGEFVCIVGGSGTGKTTLLDALSGVRPATAGHVLYNGLDLYEHLELYRHALGYVPQDDIVHPELTVDQTLYYTARLRLPTDTQRSEIDDRLAEVLGDLDLAPRHSTQVRRLSGGQRKRVSIGVELLAKPEVFFLDEPTSGLDPALDGRMMDLMRTLANQGRTVILTTHATKNIMVGDKLIFMAQGGRLAYFGPPRESLAFFGLDDFTDIYRLLDEDGAAEHWQQRYRASEQSHRYVEERLERPQDGEADQANQTSQPVPVSSIRQLAWLSLRYLTILRGDPIALLVLLLAAPICGLLLSSNFTQNVFALDWQDGGDARQAIALLFLLVTTSMFLAGFVAARSVAEEIPIFRRERLVNLRILPYLLSKVSVLALFSIAQAGLLIATVAWRVDFPGSPKSLLELWAALSLTNVAAIGLGLLVSSVVTSGLQATLLFVIALIPQFASSGATVPISQITDVAKVMSMVTISRWALSMLGYFVDINARLDAQFPRNDYADQFNHEPRDAALIIFGLFAVSLIGAIIALKRRDAR